MFYDSHSHIAPFSEDASQTISELLASADRQGLAGVCVTDHWEKDMFYACREDIFDLDAYFRVLPPVQAARPADAARLFIGVEVGYLPHLTGHLAGLAASRPFDGVIMSLHVLKGADPFSDTTMFQAGKQRLYSAWLRETTEMIRRCPDFDMLGHFDYVSRYGPFPDRKMRYAEMPSEFDALLGALAEMGKALEINTRTTVKLRKVGYSIAESWPDPAILHRFRELGGRYVTLGSDAHHPGEAGALFGEAAAWLRQQGWRQLAHFEQRQVILSPL